MKKIMLFVVVVLISSILFGCGLKHVNNVNHDKATDFCEELKKSDDDGNGFICWMTRKGLTGYKVIFYSSVKDEEPEIYNFGF